MIRRTLLLCSIGICILAGADRAHAQFLDMSRMIQNELNFQNMFYPWAWQGSVRAALATPNHPGALPFNAGTISNSINQSNRAFDGYVQQLRANGRRGDRAMHNWGNAQRGFWDYYDPPAATMYQLPYSHNAYHVDRGGYVHPGPVPQGGWGDNVYPIER